MIPALAAALVHLLWQGAVAALLVAFTQPWLKSPRSRYALACFALFSLPLAFAATAAWAGVIGAGNATPAHGLLLAPGLAPWLVALWLTGAAACSLHAAFGWLLAQRLRRRVASAIPESWATAVAAMRERLGIRRIVRLGTSAAVAGPCVLGWLRPIVVFPASALTGLSSEQVEAVLAHELAHIRRFDYLVNLLQRGVEAAFFFHPGVWWLSRQISDTREHCCDDLALAALGDRSTPAAYARTLLDLAVPAPVGLALSGGSLTARVCRILGRPSSAMRGTRVLALAAPLALACVLVLGGATARRGAAVPVPPLPAAPAPVARAVAVPLAVPAPAIKVALATPVPQRQPSSAVPQASKIVFAWTLAPVTQCHSAQVLSPALAPDGEIVFIHRTVTQCLPALQPVEVLVIT